MSLENVYFWSYNCYCICVWLESVRWWVLSNISLKREFKEKSVFLCVCFVTGILQKKKLFVYFLNYTLMKEIQLLYAWAYTEAILWYLEIPVVCLNTNGNELKMHNQMIHCAQFLSWRFFFKFQATCILLWNLNTCLIEDALVKYISRCISCHTAPPTYLRLSCEKTLCPVVRRGSSSVDRARDSWSEVVDLIPCAHSLLVGRWQYNVAGCDRSHDLPALSLCACGSTWNCLSIVLGPVCEIA